MQFQINTFVAGGVQVCYRYELPAAPPPDVIPEVTPPSTPLPPVTPATIPRTLPATGRTSAPLTVVGVLAIAIGGALAWRYRSPRPRFDA